jgi:adenylyltransferase/sulfurtransferase
VYIANEEDLTDRCYTTLDIPMETFLSDPIGQLRSISKTADLPSEVYFMCRRGNDSLISAQALRAALSESEAGKEGEICRVKDVVGGVRAWSDKVDPTFPMY